MAGAHSRSVLAGPMIASCACKPKTHAQLGPLGVPRAPFWGWWMTQRLVQKSTPKRAKEKKCRAVNASVATALATADLVDGADDERRRGGGCGLCGCCGLCVGVVNGDREVP